MRMTQRNPSGTTYRLPLCRAGQFRVEHGHGQADIYGDPINRLGQFEDLGLEPEEIVRALQEVERYRELRKHWEKEEK